VNTATGALQGKKVAIVGAGVSGLVAGYRLKQRGATVTLFERNDYVGGRTQSVHLGGFTFDCGALVMLPTYHNVYALIRELGIESHVHKTAPRLAVVRNGKRHSFDYAHPLRSAISMQLLSWPSKLKLLKLLPVLTKYWSRLHYRSMGDLEPLDHESTRDWVVRELNEEIDDYLANPFIRINSLTDTRSAPIGEWIWQLAAYKSPTICQFDKGMVFYAQTLARDQDVRLETPVTKVSILGKRAKVEWSPNGIGTASDIFDACILAVPPPFASRIAPTVTQAQKKFFEKIEPVRMISLHLGLGFRPDVEDAIVMFPEKESADLLDIVYDHLKGPGRAPPGKGAMAIQTTREWSAAHADDTDEQIVEALLPLVEAHAGPLRGRIEVSYVHRWDYVCAVTFPGYYTLLRDHVRQRATDTPLYFCGDWFSGGIEGATTCGLIAVDDVTRYFEQPQTALVVGEKGDANATAT
jgi:oxygen-dependent protoporphyrinogen oxidase